MKPDTCEVCFKAIISKQQTLFWPKFVVGTSCVTFKIRRERKEIKYTPVHEQDLVLHLFVPYPLSHGRIAYTHRREKILSDLHLSMLRRRAVPVLFFKQFGEIGHVCMYTFVNVLIYQRDANVYRGSICCTRTYSKTLQNTGRRFPLPPLFVPNHAFNVVIHTREPHLIESKDVTHACTCNKTRSGGKRLMNLQGLFGLVQTNMHRNVRLRIFDTASETPHLINGHIVCPLAIDSSNHCPFNYACAKIGNVSANAVILKEQSRLVFS